MRGAMFTAEFLGRGVQGTGFKTSTTDSSRKASGTEKQKAQLCCSSSPLAGEKLVVAHVGFQTLPEDRVGLGALLLGD